MTHIGKRPTEAMYRSGSYTIRHRQTNEVLYTSESATDARSALLEALASGADLTGADLAGADLTGADLSGADLSGADLAGADLSGADLSGADLRRADLTRADLTGAVMSGADLTRADLAAIRADVESVLAACPHEVSALREALLDGRIDGSTYEGECCCLVGTLATARGCHYDAIPAVAPDTARPAERWFLGIRPGDTPSTSPIAAITLDWIDQWLAARPVATV